MTLWRNLLSLTVGLPVWLGAADRDMMNLVMPDATAVIEINVAKIVASPIRSAVEQAMQQGMGAQLKAELNRRPQFSEQMADLAKIDWRRDVEDVLIAGGAEAQSPRLVIIRSSLNPARIRALAAFRGEASEYRGVPMLAASQPGSGVIAFLDNSILLIGPMKDVRAAIERRKQSRMPSAFLSAQAAKYKDFAIWVAAAGPIRAPALGRAAGSPAAAKITEFLGKVAAFDAGLRFSPDLEVAGTLEARTEKAAAELAGVLRWLTAGAAGTEGFKYQVTGKRIRLSLNVPEEQIRAGLRHIQAQRAALPPIDETGPPPPPRGTIRVQSSEGTVLIRNQP